MGDDGVLAGTLHQVAQKADDLDASVAFYTDVLGLELIARFDPPGLAFVRLGDTRLLLERSAPPATLYLRVADIQAAYGALADRGVVFEDEPHLIHRDDEGTFGPAGEEEWMTFFRDPAGNLLALASRR
ncbi:MAG: VOC family protein [Acidimicrobiales bacterium]